MDLIDDIYFVSTCLRGKADLVYQCPYVVYRVVRSCIELMDIQRGAFIKRNAGITLVTGLTIFRSVLAIDGFGQYPCTGCLANSSRTAKQKSMCQLVMFDRIF